MRRDQLLQAIEQKRKELGNLVEEQQLPCSDTQVLDKSMELDALLNLLHGEAAQ